jgi:hypothetical protein
MNDTELVQNADFLGIALEEIEHGNYEVAADFVGGVQENLLDTADKQ